jgi:fatty acid desaturase
MSGSRGKHPPALMATMLVLVAACVAAIVLLSAVGGVVWLVVAVSCLLVATGLVVGDTYDLMSLTPNADARDDES